MIKVFFHLFDPVDGPATESLWAEMLNDGSCYIKNVPFYVTGISFDDRISVKKKGEKFFFDKVLESNGHSTYRIYRLDSTYEQFDFFWNLLEKLGCTYEKGTEHLYAIDVPPLSNIYKVYEILELGTKRGAWDFDEGHCGHL